MDGQHQSSFKQDLRPRLLRLVAGVGATKRGESSRSKQVRAGKTALGDVTKISKSDLELRSPVLSRAPGEASVALSSLTLCMK